MGTGGGTRGTARPKGRPMIIFSPGPANISARVRQALTLPDIGHRETEFTSLLQETRSLLLEVSGVSGDYSPVVLTGSGTTGIEASITSLGGSVNGVLVLSNGVYGERAAQIAQVFGIPHKLEKFDWTAPIPLDRAEELIAATDHDAVYLIHHETTTGVLNPLREIAAVAKDHGKWVMADTVSSIGGEELDPESWGVDLIIGSANKCLRGVPGIAFVVASGPFLEAISHRRPVAYSTDLVGTLKREEDGETPFTPAVQATYALREACRELLEEGVDNRIVHYRQIARALRDGLSNLELSFPVLRRHLSNTMTPVMLPEGVAYDALHRPLKERGYVIYKSQGALSETTFRLGTVGVLSQDDVSGFLEALGDVL